MIRILAINPGATSTKVAIFDDDKVLFKKKVEHTSKEFEGFSTVFDQYEYRMALILDACKEAAISPETLDAVVGRGGLLKPIASGVYQVNERMIEDLRKAEFGEHASNLGAVLAYNLANSVNIPAFIVDPVSVDEMEPVARVSGMPEIQRISKAHALNMKSVARETAKNMGKEYEDINLIIAHLGSGISIAAHCRGRMIDVSNGMDEGAFSLDRCGGLPTGPLLNLCFSGKSGYEELKRKLLGDGGIYAYLGTRDLRDVEQMALGGNAQAELLLQAMAYQVAKEIGAMAAVLAGKVDRIVLTGGIAYSQKIIDAVIDKVAFIAPTVVLPGEEELESMARGALRVLSGVESLKEYQ